MKNWWHCMVEVFRNRPSLCMNALKQFSSSIRYEIIMQISSDQPTGIFVCWRDSAYFKLFVYMSFPDGSAVKNPPAGTGDTGSIPRSERSAGVGNGCYTSILAWQIPWTEEPDRLQSMRSKELCVYTHTRTRTHTHTHTHRSWSKSGPKVFFVKFYCFEFSCGFWSSSSVYRYSFLWILGKHIFFSFIY